MSLYKMREVARRLLRKTHCNCPVRCIYCGARRRRDAVGHRCPTKNCQWEHGYKGCTLNTVDSGVSPK